MSAREKFLFTVLVLAGFVVLNLLGFRAYREAASTTRSRLEATQARLDQAKLLAAHADLYREQMAWLAEHEPEPKAYQDVQTQLQQFAESSALSMGLTISSQELLPTDETTNYFHRAQIRINLTGREEALYRWFDAIIDPTQLRTAYQIRLSPNGQDDSLIDCSATLAQWFPPL